MRSQYPLYRESFYVRIIERYLYYETLLALLTMLRSVEVILKFSEGNKKWSCHQYCREYSQMRHPLCIYLRIKNFTVSLWKTERFRRGIDLLHAVSFPFISEHDSIIYEKCNKLSLSFKFYYFLVILGISEYMVDTKRD